MIVPRFKEEEELIKKARELKYCVPSDVKAFLSHFIRNAVVEIRWITKEDPAVLKVLRRITDALEEIGA